MGPAQIVCLTIVTDDRKTGNAYSANRVDSSRCAGTDTLSGPMSSDERIDRVSSAALGATSSKLSDELDACLIGVASRSGGMEASFDQRGRASNCFLAKRA